MDDSSADQKDPEKFDWLALHVKLTARAVARFRERGCIGKHSVLPNTGLSPEDLATKTLFAIMQNEKWRELVTKGDINKYSGKALFNDFLDAVGKLEYELTSITDSLDAELVKSLENPGGANDVIEASEAADLYRSLEPQLGDDEMAKAYLYLWLVQGIEKREDLAYLLGMSPRQVTDIRRRLFGKLLPKVARIFRGRRFQE